MITLININSIECSLHAKRGSKQETVDSILMRRSLLLTSDWSWCSLEVQVYSSNRRDQLWISSIKTFFYCIIPSLHPGTSAAAYLCTIPSMSPARIVRHALAFVIWIQLPVGTEFIFEFSSLASQRVCSHCTVSGQLYIHFSLFLQVSFDIFQSNVMLHVKAKTDLRILMGDGCTGNGTHMASLASTWKSTRACNCKISNTVVLVSSINGLLLMFIWQQLKVWISLHLVWFVFYMKYKHP